MSFTRLMEIVSEVGEIKRDQSQYLYGTVTGDDPLTVTLEGERGDVVRPALGVEVAVGDRVVLVRSGSFVMIMGHAGGPQTSETVWAIGQGVENLGDYAHEIGVAAKLTQEHLDDIAPVVEGLKDYHDDVILGFVEDTNTELGKIPGIRESAEQAGRDALAAVQTAQDAYAARTPSVKIESTRGTVFKNNTVGTDLNVTVFMGDQTITNITDLREEFGGGAYLEWWWRRLDDEAFGLISSADDRLSRSGFTLSLSPADVDGQTTFRVTLNS